MLETLERMWRGILESLPRLGVAVLLFVLVLAVAVTARHGAQRFAARRQARRSLTLAMGRLAFGAIALLGVLLAAVVAFPGFTPGDLVRILGIGGVAIGFAFKDIFQNFLAGILLLATEPFRIGDQIAVDEFEGTVEDIQTRATFIRTYDGRIVVLPNADLYTKPVIVNTARQTRRNEYDIGIGYGDDVERAREIIIGAMRDAEGVLPDPKADCILVAYGESAVMLRARWWSESHIADQLLARDRVLTSVKARLQEAGIDLPFPTRQVLFHDQTEETDGDRTRQREGWPEPEGEAPAPRSIAAALLAGRRRGGEGERGGGR